MVILFAHLWRVFLIYRLIYFLLGLFCTSTLCMPSFMLSAFFFPPSSISYFLSFFLLFLLRAVIVNGKRRRRAYILYSKLYTRIIFYESFRNGRVCPDTISKYTFYGGKKRRVSTIEYRNCWIWEVEPHQITVFLPGANVLSILIRHRQVVLDRWKSEKIEKMVIFWS